MTDPAAGPLPPSSPTPGDFVTSARLALADQGAPTDDAHVIACLAGICARLYRGCAYGFRQVSTPPARYAVAPKPKPRDIE